MTRRFLTAVCFLQLSIFAGAQDTQNITVTLTVPQVLNLSVENSAVTIAFAPADYDESTGNGSKVNAAASTISVASNRAWVLSARAASSTFSYTPLAGDGNPNKPAGDLALKLSSDSTYLPVSTSNATLTTGNAGGTSESGNQFTVDYRVTSTLKNDPPGSYSIGVILTLTAP